MGVRTRFAALRDRAAALPDPAPPGPAGRVPWRALFAVVFVVSLATHLYGSAAPLFWGHYGYHTAEYGLRARNCLRHGSCLSPSQTTGLKKPTPGSYYLHHPPFWQPFMVASTAVFGDDPVVVRVTGIAATMLALLAVWGALRRWWDPQKAVVGAAVFALLPQVLMFGTLPHTEQPALALGILSVALLFRFFDERRVRHAAAALVCVFLAGQTDWIVYPFFVVAACYWFARAAARWWRHRQPADADAAVAGLSRATLEALAGCALAAATMFLGVLHLVHAQKADVLGDLIGSMTGRASVSPAESASYLKSMFAFAKDAFTLPGILLTGAGVVYGAGKTAFRLFQRRGRPAELIPWALLLSFVAYLFVFKKVMIIHRYRWWFLAGAAAFFVADLLVDAGRLLRAQVVDRLWRAPPADPAPDGAEAKARPGRPRLRRFVRGAVAALPAAAFTAYLAVGAPHVLDFSRKTGGTYGAPYDSTYPQITVMQAVHDRTRLGDSVLIHNEIGARLEMLYVLDRDVTFVGAVSASSPSGGADYAVITSFSANVDHKALLARYKVEIFGHFWLVHFKRRGPDLTVYALRSEEPGALWWFFSSSAYPPVQFVPSGPARAQQMLSFYGVPAAKPAWESESDPRFLQDAFEKARQRGDKAAADGYLARLRRAFPGQRSAMLTPGVELLGYRFHQDVQVFEAYLHVRKAQETDWHVFFHSNRVGDRSFLNLGDVLVKAADWKPGAVVRVDKLVWQSGLVDMRIGLWRPPDTHAPPKTGPDVGLPVGRLDLGTQYRL